MLFYSAFLGVPNVRKFRPFTMNVCFLFHYLIIYDDYFI
jgi:hypothetical protein